MSFIHLLVFFFMLTYCAMATTQCTNIYNKYTHIDDKRERSTLLFEWMLFLRHFSFDEKELAKNDNNKIQFPWRHSPQTLCLCRTANTCKSIVENMGIHKFNRRVGAGKANDMQQVLKTTRTRTKTTFSEVEPKIENEETNERKMCRGRNEKANRNRNIFDR